MQSSRKRPIPCLPTIHVQYRTPKSVSTDQCRIFLSTVNNHQNKKTPVNLYIGHDWNFINPTARIDQKEHEMTINILLYKAKPSSLISNNTLTSKKYTNKMQLTSVNFYRNMIN